MSSKNKHDKKTANVINRTTSETLRLGDAEASIGLRILPPSSNSISSAGSRKKIQNSSSSFQITGVSLTRCDFGDDSADDLDESHTDDISRVTDNETPSFSEDSRDTDDHAGYEAPTTNPPIATLMVPTEKQSKPPDGDSGARFKVVKIPSVVPFSRGRWTCFDYLDNSDQNLNVGYIFSQQKFVNKQTVAARHVQSDCAPSSSKYGSSMLFYENPFLTDLSPHHTTLQPNSSANRPITPNSFTHTGPTVSTMDTGGRTAQEIGSSHVQNEASKPPTMNNSQKVKGNNTSDELSDIKVALTSTVLAADSGSAPNNNNIDRKIEEALDAVKSHLMVAVHKEVDFLKTRVSTLEGRVNELEIENSILRVNYLLFKS